ncbi:MAG: hypothetical protein CSA76_02540 [Spirochaetales bacterium]|nr:MAG: hypothetical protein CSA76_02540 [Spirochaetales bacterium]
MPEKIHYDDNLYFLAAFIRALNDAVKLKVDAEFFAEKILEDTFFIDLSIQKIYGSLKSNIHLIRRSNYLHTVMRVKQSYIELLEDLLSLQGDLADPFASVTSKLRKMAVVHRQEVRTILKDLQSEQFSENSHELTSRDELHFLMQPMEELTEAQA